MSGHKLRDNHRKRPQRDKGDRRDGNHECGLPIEPRQLLAAALEESARAGAAVARARAHHGQRGRGHVHAVDGDGLPHGPEPVVEVEFLIPLSNKTRV